MQFALNFVRMDKSKYWKCVLKICKQSFIKCIPFDDF
jgi:hypothetical protein